MPNFRDHKKEKENLIDTQMVAFKVFNLSVKGGRSFKILFFTQIGHVRGGAGAKINHGKKHS